MSTYVLAPWFVQQFFDDNGEPLSGGKVYSFASGTTTPAPTYADDIGTQNPNPVILSASGRARLYFGARSYKLLITDANDVPVGLTMDPVSSTALGSEGVDVELFEFGGDANAPVTTTTYLAGATIDKLHPGTAVWSVASENVVGLIALQATGYQDTSGTLTVALVNLSDGSPDTPLVTLDITSTTGEVATSGPITLGVTGTHRHYGIKPKVSAQTGFVWGLKIVRII